MSTRWVTFDCFGTLVDWHSGFADILRPVAGERTAELIGVYHRFERLLEQERPHLRYRDVLQRGVARAAAEIGLPVTEAQTRSLPDRWGAQRVFDDVEPALAALRKDGWKLAVLTNCDVDLFARTHESFRTRFDLVVTAEQVMDYKPSLAHFRWFWRASGVDAGDWVHAACSWYHDIQAAREMGIRRIWVDRDRTGDDAAAATLRIDDIGSLPAAVERALAMEP
jgi:2-haloacid dehalogenase